jgi:hypothetical protein
MQISEQFYLITEHLEVYDVLRVRRVTMLSSVQGMAPYYENHKHPLGEHRHFEMLNLLERRYSSALSQRLYYRIH